MEWQEPVGPRRDEKMCDNVRVSMSPTTLKLPVNPATSPLPNTMAKMAGVVLGPRADAQLPSRMGQPLTAVRLPPRGPERPPPGGLCISQHPQLRTPPLKLGHSCSDIFISVPEVIYPRGSGGCRVPSSISQHGERQSTESMLITVSGPHPSPPHH